MSKKIWEVFFTWKRPFFLGLQISMLVLRPSDQSSVGSYCGCDLSGRGLSGLSKIQFSVIPTA